jgi:hypothetical protein
MHWSRGYTGSLGLEKEEALIHDCLVIVHLGSQPPDDGNDSSRGEGHQQLPDLDSFLHTVLLEASILHTGQHTGTGRVPIMVGATYGQASQNGWVPVMGGCHSCAVPTRGRVALDMNGWPVCMDLAADLKKIRSISLTITARRADYHCLKADRRTQDKLYNE